MLAKVIRWIAWIAILPLVVVLLNVMIHSPLLSANFIIAFGIGLLLVWVRVEFIPKTPPEICGFAPSPPPPYLLDCANNVSQT